MKKRLLIIGLFALLLVLAGCKNRIDVGQPSDTAKLDKINGVPDLVVQPKPVTEPVVEKPVETLPPVVEEPKTLQNEFVVKKGDSFTFGKNTIKVKDIQSSTYVILDVNGETIVFDETRTSDIIGDMLLTYADSNFNKDQTITFKADPFVLKENEYLLNYKDKVTVNGDTIKLENFEYDTGFKIDAIWVSATSDSSVAKIREGQELKVGLVKVKALKVKYGTSLRHYAHVSITPA